MVKNQFKESEIGETKRRARYTLAYKMEAVRLIKGGQAVSVTAQILGIPKASLDNWSSSAPKANSRALGTNRSALRKWSWPGCAPSLPTSLSDVEQPGCHGGAQRRGVQNLPPSQIVPRLADQGCYIASESTLYRLLHQVGQMRHRRLERVPSTNGLVKPTHNVGQSRPAAGAMSIRSISIPRPQPRSPATSKKPRNSTPSRDIYLDSRRNRCAEHP